MLAEETRYRRRGCQRRRGPRGRGRATDAAALCERGRRAAEGAGAGADGAAAEAVPMPLLSILLSTSEGGEATSGSLRGCPGRLGGGAGAGDGGGGDGGGGRGGGGTGG